jgi:flagellar motility protein MotE (MotC chaperone)
LLQRLGERRAELDRRESDLVMRTALVEAAEKRLDERTRELEALQVQVNSLVDEKQVTEDEGFKAIVSMYENMKPKEAAKIFDTLDIEVLLRVTRAMNPRKMSPILAAMDTKPAEELTTALASKGPSRTVADAGEDLANLPQIVGQ